jgi:T-complex protein 1 subunit beta
LWWCPSGRQLFAEAGVTAIEHADFEGVERLGLVLGAEVP